MRIRLTLAYDGQPFSGWQIQPQAPSVQETLEKALADVAGQPLRLHGSGRTDAGVHALAQVAHFDAPDHLTLGPANWVPALNTKLPPSIRVLEARDVAPDFHARFSSQAKHYHYHLDTTPILHPHRAHRTWHLPRPFDAQALADALALYQGTHDFRNFSARRGNETPDTDHQRTLFSTQLHPTDHGYRLEFVGNGFLYKMVRLLVGGAHEVARGKWTLTDLQARLDHPTEGSPPPAAPADGLHLVQVDY